MPLPEHQFDEILRNQRHFEPASPDLASRIIAAARPQLRPVRITLAAWFQALLESLLPKPTMALTAMLTLGVAIGFGLPTLVSINGSGTNVVQAYMEDDGAIL